MKYRILITALLSLLPIAPLLAADSPPPVADAAPAKTAELVFEPSLKAAEAAAAARKAPLIIVFDASWCGWCHKMDEETFADEQVRSLGGNFVWVKVDIDKQPDVAADFHVRGIPHTVIISTKGELASQRIGYVPAEAFARFLTSNMETPKPADASPMPPGPGSANGPAAPSAVEQQAAVLKLVTDMAQPDRADRNADLTALNKLGPAIQPMLVSLLADKRLGIRAAAAQALMHITQAELPFDPFADAPTRQKQAQAWNTWVAAHAPDAKPSAAQPTSTPNPS